MDINPKWEFVADTVMGGLSNGQLSVGIVAGRSSARLTGTVSLDNNGGFIQMASNINQDGTPFDSSKWRGLELEVFGNGEDYDLRLRTAQLTRPWQSFRTSFKAPNTWTCIHLPFDVFVPHKTDTQFDPRALRRIGVLAIGRVMVADVAVSALRLKA